MTEAPWIGTSLKTKDKRVQTDAAVVLHVMTRGLILEAPLGGKLLPLVMWPPVCMGIHSCMHSCGYSRIPELSWLREALSMTHERFQQTQRKHMYACSTYSLRRIISRERKGN